MNFKKLFLFLLSIWLLPAAYSQTSLPFWQGKERELRYTPEGDAFVNVNGKQRFTRAIYGTNTGFRFETSDYPEVGLYMPRLGGSMYLALQNGNKVLWVKDLKRIESRFRSGQRTYILSDPKVLGKGTITIDLMALADADGLVMRSVSKNIPKGVKMLCIYGGANNQRFSREGDLGADPVDCFYIKAEHCKDNFYQIKENSFTLHYGEGAIALSEAEAYENKEALKDLKLDNNVKLNASLIQGVFPQGTHFQLKDATLVNNLDFLIASSKKHLNVLLASYELKGTEYVELINPQSKSAHSYSSLPIVFEQALNFRTKIAGHIKIQTPDPYINTLGGIFSGAEDATWEDPGYLHGAIGWRMPLTGWRAAYLADLVGKHDRARRHFEGYVNAQVKDVPVTLPHMQDSVLHGARSLKKWGTPMYSNGYICRNPNRTDVMHHYDMNLVFIDELLWHLLWTGDWDYAKRVFPVIKSHLAWEKQLFDPDNDHLYDGYCCIWASDALQYNGGMVTHSTAYNYRANRLAAFLAEKLGEDSSPYKIEAESILKALNTTLWMKGKGWWAEFKDNMGNKLLHPNAALWTIYHSIDSDIHDSFKAYQATRYVDTQFKHIPVVAYGYPETDNYVLPTTNWQPYMWSINNVAFGEMMHTALAFWQSGRTQEAFKMFKGTVLDAMYFGSGPGNITQVSFYDAARGEMYRDFADPVAMGVRAMIQGMYGVVPNLLENKLTIRPSFPSDWAFASLETDNMIYDFKRSGNTDTYHFTPKLRKTSDLILEVNTYKEGVRSVKVNGHYVKYNSIESAIGMPKLQIEAGFSDSYKIEIEWSGKKIEFQPIEVCAVQGERFSFSLPVAEGELYDPQSVLEGAKIIRGLLTGKVIGELGYRTLFLKRTLANLTYWQPVHFTVKPKVEMINRGEESTLSFSIINNSAHALKGDLILNNELQQQAISLSPGAKLNFSFDAPVVVWGSNKIELRCENERYIFTAINWNLAQKKERYHHVNLTSFFNDKVTNIFEYGKYVSPRWPYTTLCVPTQGMGQWCHPNDLSSINDSGLRLKAGTDNCFRLPQGLSFATPSAKDKNNIAFTTLWDNYPDSVTVPLQGKASKAYFLIAASTYHMQSHILNGLIRVYYQDGTSDVLNLVLPENLLPLDQDIFIDNWAFRSKEPRPYRIRLQTGEVDRYHAGRLHKKMSNDPIYIEGGMATVLDLCLDPQKELRCMTLETVGNEVIIGLMAVTLLP